MHDHAPDNLDMQHGKACECHDFFCCECFGCLQMLCYSTCHLPNVLCDNKQCCSRYVSMAMQHVASFRRCLSGATSSQTLPIQATSMPPTPLRYALPANCFAQGLGIQGFSSNCFGNLDNNCSACPCGIGYIAYRCHRQLMSENSWEGKTCCQLCEPLCSTLGPSLTRNSLLLFYNSKHVCCC